jgi:hypothetical protein
MPDWCVTLSVLLLAGLRLTAAGLPVEGKTASGLSFDGPIAAVTAETLLLDQPGSMQIGIPLTAITRIHPVAEVLADPGLLEFLETALPLLPHWDTRVIEAICDRLDAAARDGQWSLIERWTRRLVRIEANPLLRDRVRLLQARSLFELGLRRPARQCVNALLANTDPLQAPPRLCWLAARLASLEGQPAEARFWAGLPAMQIPAARGQLAEELDQLAAKLDTSEP